MQHTFSLSRAHKLVERLHSQYDATLSQMEALLTPVVVNVVGDESKADKQAEKFAALGTSAENISGVATKIRRAIAAKNGEIGLHEKLALRAALNRQINSLQNLLERGQYLSNTALDGEQVSAYMARTAHQASLPVIKVKVFSEKVQADLEGQIAKLKRQEITVGDEINDLNHNKIEAEVPQDIAELIGLA